MITVLVWMTMFWPEVFVALLLWCIILFVWGILNPPERRAALRTMWVSMAAFGLYSLPVAVLVFFLIPRIG